LIEVGKVSQKKSLHWKWIRYRDGIWIPHRKRTYLYWFKFLQEAQRSPDFKVNWNKYRGWGGANEVMGSRFDDWWEDHWKDLFGVEGKSDVLTKVKFPLTTTQPKTEAIRISWLVWMNRDTPPDYVSRLSQYGGGTHYPKRGSNHLAIARKIIATEKRQTYLAPLDPDDDTNENEDKVIASLIGRYKRRAKKTTENVCEGLFP
jgi:hypothetical protein